VVAGGEGIKTTENKIHWPRGYKCLINCMVNDDISVFLLLGSHFTCYSTFVVRSGNEAISTIDLYITACPKNV